MGMTWSLSPQIEMILDLSLSSIKSNITTAVVRLVRRQPRFHVDWVGSTSRELGFSPLISRRRVTRE